MEDILNCPFCGHNKLVVYSTGELTSDKSCMIRCSNCHSESGLYKTREEAVKHWNKRTLPTKGSDITNIQSQEKKCDIKQMIIDKEEELISVNEKYFFGINDLLTAQINILATLLLDIEEQEEKILEE